MSLFQWPGRTSKVAFRDRVCVAFQEGLLQATIKSIGELEIQITGLGGGKSLSVWLGGAHDEFCENPEEANEIIAR